MKRFSAELNELIRLSGKSHNQVAAHSMVDRAYLTRLLTGEKANPSPETVIRLWVGIVFDETLLAKNPDLVYGLEKLLLAAYWTSASDKLLSGVGVGNARTTAD